MDFSSLALQKLLQLFPELSGFVVTFKDVTQDVSSLEDTDVSVGIFILQVGSKYFYLPIIGKGEIIQPIDSIFDLENQCFLPLTRGFVNRLSTASLNEPGKPSKIPDTVVKNPSVYDLVVPPRTGKFVYASSSRLSEFLAVLPNLTKKAMLDKVSEDKEIYSALHRLFGLENIIHSLKPSAPLVVATPKPAVEIITEGKNLAEHEITSILDKGYAVRGENPSTRVAVLAHDFDKMGKLRQIGNIDAGQDFDIILKTGETNTAFIPKRSKSLPQFPALLKNRHGNFSEQVPAIFADGSFTIASHLVAVGEGRSSHETIKDLFSYKPAITPNELDSAIRYFAIFTPDMELLGIYEGASVSRTPLGVTIVATSILGFHSTEGYCSRDRATINAYRNCVTIDASNPKNMFIPINTLIAPLSKEVFNEDKFEKNINSAAARLELSTLMALGSAADIGFDGVEYSFNRKPVGNEAKIVEVLIVQQGISPEKAESFVKQAKENKHVKVYLSKQAEDFAPSEIPSYGVNPPEQTTGFGINGNFGNNLTTAAGTNDAQTVEATVISELLQVADMRGYIREYLPEIKEAVDKLGRTLFLSRLKMDQLAINHNASEVFSFIANLRNCYRMLGDNYIKLEEMVSDSENVTEKDEAK